MTIDPSMELSSRYDPKQVEKKWYSHWQQCNYFKSTPDEREPFSVVIPPPNVTGVLHMGHMLNNTVQDLLVRKARLCGKNACWVPGTDHASIATEAKVVRWLKETKNINKGDIPRDKFIEYVWEWTRNYGGQILEQLKRLGASCDWERTAFTMDDVRSKMVIRVFVDLYRKGLLYRGLRMVNWDPEAQTVLSNEEVIYQEEKSTLYYIKYFIPGEEKKWITIATTRPETILGDTAIAVHPEDPRYTSLRGQSVTVPLVKRVIPVIFDDYVDREFGTGALKITPAHDPNDYEIGLKHNLEVIDVIAPDGTMNKEAKFFIGIDRLEARKLAIEELQKLGLLEKTEPYDHSVGTSERTGALVEPKLSLQWYVRMSELAKPALEGVLADDIEFFPKNMKNTYRHWMENIRDWCISRQLWWGHRIPAYYVDEEIFVAETAQDALQEARIKLKRPNLQTQDLRQDEDVLDTWFSSWLWPFSVFDGLDQNKDIDYYYPTSVLVTAWDIIFLWVARMIMAGYHWKGEKPFAHVYFTGMVRDKQRRRMSKSLGNSPDVLALMDNFGADGVRFGMLSCSPAGGDLLFNEKLCEQGRNFCNKIWNAFRLVKQWDHSGFSGNGLTPAEGAACAWLEEKTKKVMGDLETNYQSYKLSEGLINLYSFIWNDFCSWFLEWVKPDSKAKISEEVYKKTLNYFEKIMTVLHPFMPFISEEIWHNLREREPGDDCMVSAYPSIDTPDEEIIEQFEFLQEVVTKIRDIRNKQGVKRQEALKLYFRKSVRIAELLKDEGFRQLLLKSGNLDGMEELPSGHPGKNLVPFVAGAEKFFIRLEKDFNPKEERIKLEEELKYQERFIEVAIKKLQNERFIHNAPEEVVNRERKKLADGEKRIKVIRESLERLYKLDE